MNIKEAVAALISGSDVDETVSLLIDEKKYQTPKFVQHCVSAVMKEKGYPKERAFAICYAQRNKGKAKGKSYERSHAKEHTPARRKQFEKDIDYKGVHER